MKNTIDNNNTECNVFNIPHRWITFRIGVSASVCQRFDENLVGSGLVKTNCV